MRLVGSNLRCVRGGREVFRGLNLDLGAGEALAIAGPNGAGKSSLLRVIAGLVRLAEGTIALEGGASELTLAEQSHYVGHLDPVKPSLTVAENLHFWAAFLDGSGLPAPDALAAVGLAELAALPGAYLSAGQRRRLSLARLLTVRRPIWLLDEPASALDTAGQDRLTELMQDHLAAGGVILAATHGPLGLEGAGELRLGQAEAPWPH